MKNLFALLAAGLVVSSAVSVSAQTRMLGAEEFRLDDGSGNTLTLQDNGAWTGDGVYQFPDPATTTGEVTIQGNVFNGVNQLVKLDGSGFLPALNGSALTSLNASNISSGTLANARLSASVTLQGNTFNGISQLVQTDASGFLPALNGSALTSLNASNISSGTLADARLSSNVALLADNETVTGTWSFSNRISANNGLTVTGDDTRFSHSAAPAVDNGGGDYVITIPATTTAFTLNDDGNADPATITMPAAADGKILFIWNDDNETTDGAFAIPPGETWMFVHMTTWQRVTM